MDNSASYTSRLKRDFNLFCRSMRASKQGSIHRGSIRSRGSIKSKMPTIRENGDIGGMATVRRNGDLDIKVLQQKKQQAEIKRCVKDVKVDVVV